MRLVMKLRSTFVLLVLFAVMTGCGGNVERPNLNQGVPNQPTAPDDPAAVEALTGLAKELRKGRNGFIDQADFRGTDIGNESLEHLKGLKQLSSLLLNGTKVTDDGLKVVGTISTLRNLDLRGCKITNVGMTHLTGLKKLVALKLTGDNNLCTVDDKGLSELANLSNLRALALDSLWVSGDGLSSLATIEKLEELYVGGESGLMDDESMEKIKDCFPRLKKLRISKSRVSTEGLAHLTKLVHLEELDNSECSQIFDDGLVHLSEMKQLKRLNLWRLVITNEGVKHLAGLTKMQWLNLDNTQVTDAGLEHLAAMKELSFLHLGSTYITDEGLVHLEGLTALKDLKVTRTAVTESGAAQLKKKLPDTDIQLMYLESDL